jgi:hypothetical protein
VALAPQEIPRLAACGGIAARATAAATGPRLSEAGRASLISTPQHIQVKEAFPWRTGPPSGSFVLTVPGPAESSGCRTSGPSG